MAEWDNGKKMKMADYIIYLPGKSVKWQKGWTIGKRWNTGLEKKQVLNSTEKQQMRKFLPKAINSTKG